MKITIIGAGKLGSAIADGLLDSGIDPRDLKLTKRYVSSLDKYKSRGVVVLSDNEQAVKDADIIIICVKPQKLKIVLNEINPALEKQIIVSTVTGAKLSEIQEYLLKRLPIYVAMPNTAASIRQSMTCISTSDINKERNKQIEAIFRILGKVVFIDDELMASATVLAASGIAFALRYIRASMQGGIEIGFSSELAQKIASQTIKGASELILQHNSHPESEIDKVTTPQGITITGLNKMEQEGFSSSIIQGILASQTKIDKL